MKTSSVIRYPSSVCRRQPTDDGGRMTDNVLALRKRSTFPRPCQQSLGEVEALRQLADLGLERQQSILDVRHAALGGPQPTRGVAHFPAAQAAAVPVVEVSRPA